MLHKSWFFVIVFFFEIHQQGVILFICQSADRPATLVYHGSSAETKPQNTEGCGGGRTWHPMSFKPRDLLQAS